MQRLVRIAGSFSIVLVAYWVYAHTAVPLIEPSVKSANGAAGEKGGAVFDPPPAEDYRYKEIEGLFPEPGYHWELDREKKPMILDIDNRAKLLLQKYETLEDGRIKLSPCTVVFLHDGPAESEAERKRQAVVLEAPDGAIVKFDAPIDSKLLKIGRPVGGHLLGDIRIRSEGKSPGPEDDLLIRARDVVWNDRDATSENPVEFRWGQNYGRGRGLHIKLAENTDAPADGGTPNVSDIEVFEMRNIDQLHLNVADKMARDGSAESSAAASSATPSAAGEQVDIACRGPFRFNVVKRVATFEDKVEVMRLDPLGGPADQLLGDKLSMYFIPRDKDADTPGTSADKLEPERIEAEGKPVTLTSPRENVFVQGESILYNMKTKTIDLRGDSEVCLKQRGNEIYGRRIQYQQDLDKPPEALGKALVKGPGRLRGAMDDKPDQQLDVSWNGELQLYPKDGYQVISIVGGGTLEFSGFGKMSADAIYFWLLECPPEGPEKKPKMKPVKMSAKSNVVLHMVSKANDSGDVTEVSGTVDEMNVWFEETESPGGMRWESQGGSIRGENRPAGSENRPSDAPEGPSLNPMPPSGSTDGGSAAFPYPATSQNVPVQYLAPRPIHRTAYRQPVLLPDQNQIYPRTQTPLVAAPAIVRPMNATAADGTPMYPSTGAGVVPLPQEQNATSAAGRRQCFAIAGRLLDAKVVVQEPEYKLTDLTITDNVTLRQTQTLDPAEKPLTISGDKVVAEKLQSLGAAQGMNARPSEAIVKVFGRPARVEGHRLSMNGSNIVLDFGANDLKIDGPGNMEMPMPDNINGKPLAAPGSMLIKWKEGMNFDGLTATFRREIDASSPMRHLQTEMLSVRLAQPIRFADPELQNRKQPDASHLSCAGGVFMESVEIDEQGQRSAYIRLQATDLNYDVQSGELAAGPGWLNSVNLIDDNSAGPGFAPPVRNVSMPAGVSANPVKKLVGLHVKFEKSIAGNITSERQRIEFSDRVRLLYAPVNDWSAMLNPDKTEPLAPDEVRLKCDSLRVRNSSPFPGKSQALELDALGNSFVEGKIAESRDRDSMFYARAMRISYDASKDVLVLEGNGNTDVHFYRQLQVGAAPDDTVMRKVVYNRKKNTVSMNGVQSLQINQFAPGNK
jgi:lipopolysaccharide export system protein LptA